MSVNEAKNLGDAVVDRKTEQGFTPWPWSIGHTAGSVDRARAIFGSDGSVAIAEVVGFPLRKEEQARANERLIAAAPALYDALVTLLNTETNLGGVSAIALLDAVDKARAALALVDKSESV
jgi:hypothetical protein